MLLYGYSNFDDKYLRKHVALDENYAFLWEKNWHFQRKYVSTFLILQLEDQMFLFDAFGQIRMFG